MIDSILMAVLFAVAMVGGLAAGVTYFVSSEKSAGLGTRILASSYGPVVNSMLLAAVLWPDRHRNSTGFGHFLWLQLVPAALLIYSLAKYPGKRVFHLYLVPLVLVSWAAVLALSFLHVHGK